MRGRFVEANDETTRAEVAAIRRRMRYREQRRLLAQTDGLLGRLERRNLVGQERLDEVTRREIGRVLAQMPSRTRLRQRTWRTVQQALDGIFGVQAELLAPIQRAMHFDPTIDSADEKLARQTA